MSNEAKIEPELTEQAEMLMNRFIEHGIIRVVIPGYSLDAQQLWAELAHQAMLTGHPLKGVLDRGLVEPELTDVIAHLAGLVDECGFGNDEPNRIHTMKAPDGRIVKCDSCDGTGTVARFLSLRGDCPMRAYSGHDPLCRMWAPVAPDDVDVGALLVEAKDAGVSFSLAWDSEHWSAYSIDNGNCYEYDTPTEAVLRATVAAVKA